MNEKNNKFTYSYSAEEQKEIRDIRQKFIPPKENKMELLRRLDKSATKKGTTAALTLGIISMLLFGIGMSCTMVWAESFFILGVIIGTLGIAGMAAAYPIYLKITKREREKLVPQIMELTNELMK